MKNVLHRADLLTEGLQLGVASLEGQVAAKDTTGQDSRIVDVDDSGGSGSLGHDVNVDGKSFERGRRVDENSATTLDGPLTPFIRPE